METVKDECLEAAAAALTSEFLPRHRAHVGDPYHDPLLLENSVATDIKDLVFRPMGRD